MFSLSIPSLRWLAGAALIVVGVSSVSGQTPKRNPNWGPEGPPPTNELVLHKWSGTINVPDPVACTVDPQGRV